MTNGHNLREKNVLVMDTDSARNGRKKEDGALRHSETMICSRGVFLSHPRPDRPATHEGGEPQNPVSRNENFQANLSWLFFSRNVIPMLE